MGRNTFFYLVIFIISVPSALGSGWKLVWSDEFNYSGLPDAKKWNYEVGFIRNRELQYYTKARKENARVENGTLIIESRKEKFKNLNYNPDTNRRGRWNRSREFADYTSASLITRGKASWCYGRIEVRAKLPTGRGTWPAIWTLGTNIREVGWPMCGEIDIMENVGFDPNKIHANSHTKKYNHARNTGKGSSIKVSKPYKEFHIYAIEWYPDRIDFYVDDNKYFTFKNEGTGEAAWPYDKEQYLILNTAIGGTWGGQKGIDESIFPQKYYIDYVRIYQKRAEKSKSKGGC
ncbi:MAG: glycoside hydrolase family 16 protein [Planctomycetota bacterium]